MQRRVIDFSKLKTETKKLALESEKLGIDSNFKYNIMVFRTVEIQKLLIFLIDIDSSNGKRIPKEMNRGVDE